MGASVQKIHNQHSTVTKQDLLWFDSQVEFFALYADDPSDLISVNSTTATKGKRWPHAHSCTLCHGKYPSKFSSHASVLRLHFRPAVGTDVKVALPIVAEDDGRWQTAFLPVFRISKRLAQAVLDGLFHKNLTGSKTLCQKKCNKKSTSNNPYILVWNRSSRSFHPHDLHAHTRV